jgi:hypothetical protein
MASGHLNGSSVAPVNGRQYSSSTVPTGNNASTASVDHSRRSCRSSVEGHQPQAVGNGSIAPTVSTEHDVAHSDAAQSHGAPSSGAGTAGTAGTVGGGPSTGRGADSTFSSPAPSLRSLTTTLTTIHSASAGHVGIGHTLANTGSNAINSHSIQFTHQFPTSPPATALPSHLAPHGSGGHPATYNTATANNLLTDNASILTLASSSKRRRRRSMDTDASVRALAPSSLFGGSRESLPLSVLSASVDPTSVTSAPGLQTARPSGSALNERASIYSATGVAPALTSERNSYYAGKGGILGDNSSVKSGRLGHGRNDSVSGSIGGIAATGSPLASPRELGGASNKRLSRSDPLWTDVGEASDEVENEVEKGEGEKEKS